MKAKKFMAGDWEVERPVASFARGFVVLALLFSVFAPFMNDLPVGRWTFFMGGLLYSAFLAFIAIGIGLLPALLRRRVLFAMVMGLALGMLGEGVILVCICFQPSLAVYRLVSGGVLWLLGMFLAAGIGSAGYGWYRRLFGRKAR